MHAADERTTARPISVFPPFVGTGSIVSSQTPADIVQLRFVLVVVARLYTVAFVVRPAHCRLNKLVLEDLKCAPTRGYFR